MRILVAQDDLEAAEQLRLRPGIDDDAVLDIDPDVEIAFDAADRRDIEGLHSSGHGKFSSFKDGGLGFARLNDE